jgi:photosystem II stability/assembly factor-like uncharacterized protein
MKTHVLKVLSAAGAAGALILTGLFGAGGAAAAAVAPAQPAHPGPVASLRLHGFQPAAASFTSATWGVVLGGSNHGAGRAVRAQLALTADGGAHWSLMRAPDVWLDNGASRMPQVNRVVFADRTDGWLYDQANTGHIWATHNGGASWREITLPGNIQAMAASAHAVYAVAGDRLYRSPLGWNGWTRVGAWPRHGAMTGSMLAVSGDSVWFAGGTYLWTTADGVRWARYPLRPQGAYNGWPYELAGIAAASPRYVAFLYAAPGGMYRTATKVLVSFNGGRTAWPARQAPPPVGDVAAFAMTPGGLGTIAVAVVTPGLDNIYRSANVGQSWTTLGIQGTGGGAMLSSLQFTSPTTGCLVTAAGPGNHGHLLMTANAGQTWYPVRF